MSVDSRIKLLLLALRDRSPFFISYLPQFTKKIGQLNSYYGTVLFAVVELYQFSKVSIIPTYYSKVTQNRHVPKSFPRNSFRTVRGRFHYTLISSHAMVLLFVSLGQQEGPTAFLLTAAVSLLSD